MFKRSRTLFAIAAALLMTTVTVQADAGGRNGGHHHNVKRIIVKNNIRIVNRNVTYNIERGRHRQHRQANTYSGDVAVYYRRGVGSWSYGSVGVPVKVNYVQPNATIISLESGKNDCSMEKGVCVIRP